MHVARRGSSVSQDGEDPSFAINSQGTGVQMSWETIALMIGGIVTVTTWCTRCEQHGTEAHRHTSHAHSVVLRDTSAKIDAVLIKDGLNPHKVVERAVPAAAAAAADKDP